jgi:V/A-type H+-transporting ATPase subunit A
MEKNDKTTGTVSGIIANLVVVDVDGPVAQNEICFITHREEILMAEVIKITGNQAYVQVF